jgi:hypothetical protein
MQRRVPARVISGGGDLHDDLQICTGTGADEKCAFDNPFKASCTACQKDFYQDTYNTPTCKPCPANTATQGTGSATVAACLCNPGFSCGATTPMLDCREFGAKGDGLTDDAAALQKALDASQQQHRALFFPAGTYLINSTLTVRNPKEAQFSGWGSVRLLGEGNLGQQTVITPGRMLTALLAFSGKGPQGAAWECDGCPALGNTTNGHSVEGIAFEANRLANFSVFGPAVCRSEFLRCNFDNALIAGLYIGWGWINTVSGCWAKGNDLAALYFDWAVNSIDVVNSNFEGNHGIGIIANDGYAMRVEGCCFESTGGPAMLANRMSGLTYRANYHEANNLNSKVQWKSIISPDDHTGRGGEDVMAPACGELILNGAGGDFRLKDFMASATLNSSTAFPFYEIPPLPLGAAAAGEGCGAVIYEANFHNPSSSLCPAHSYSGVFVGSAFGVSVKANICTMCAHKDLTRICTALGGNISQDDTLFESTLNIGWAGSVQQQQQPPPQRYSLAYLSSLE